MPEVYDLLLVRVIHIIPTETHSKAVLSSLTEDGDEPLYEVALVPAVEGAVVVGTGGGTLIRSTAPGAATAPRARVPRGV